MRKRICTILGVAFAVSSISMAYAEETQGIALTLVKEFGEDVVIQFPVNTTSLWCADGYPGGSYLMTVDGTPLTEAKFNYYMQGEYGYIIVSSQEEDVNTSGLLDQNGTEIIPLQYGDIVLVGSRWAIARVLTEATPENYDYKVFGREQYYFLDRADIYYLPDARCVASLNKSEYEAAKAYDDKIKIESSDYTVNMYDSQFNPIETGMDDYAIYTNEDFYYKTFRDQKSGNTGVKDLDGNIVVEALYRSVEIEPDERGYCAVSKDGLNGLVTMDGTIALPTQYDYIYTYDYQEAGNDSDSRYFACGYATVKIGDKVKFVDAEGNITGDFPYKDLSVRPYGASALVEADTGGYLLISADGVETSLEEYKTVLPVENSKGIYYKVSMDGEGYSILEGLVDWHGNVVVPCQYKKLDVTGDAKYVLVGDSELHGPYNVYALPYPDDVTAADSNNVPSTLAVEETTVENLQNIPQGEPQTEQQNGETWDGFISFE